jgi:hypothetical protein
MRVVMTGGMTLRRAIMTDFSVDPQYLYYSMDITISYAVAVVCVARKLDAPP